MGLIHWANVIFIAGFAMREVGAFNYDQLGISIASNVLLYAAPYVFSSSSPSPKTHLMPSRPVYAAVNYIILGRVLYYIPYFSPIHPGRVMTTFLGLGGAVEALTANGVVKLINTSESESDVKLGADLVKASLLLQMAIEMCFIAIMIVFHSRCAKYNVLTSKVRTVLYILYVSSGLIIVRNSYRVAETFESLELATSELQSADDVGPTIKYEAFFWVFEASLMYLNVLLFIHWHPAKFLPGSYKTYLAKDGKTERSGPGWEDKRNVIVTILDPFDLMGLFRRNSGEPPFWEKDEQNAPTMTQESDRNIV